MGKSEGRGGRRGRGGIVGNEGGIGQSNIFIKPQSQVKILAFCKLAY